MTPENFDACLKISRKFKSDHPVINVAAIVTSPVHIVMAQKSLYIGTNSLRSFVPYVVCSVTKMVLCAVTNALTSRNKLMHSVGFMMNKCLGSSNVMRYMNSVFLQLIGDLIKLALTSD